MYKKYLWIFGKIASKNCFYHILPTSPFIFIYIFVHFRWKFAQLRGEKTTREMLDLYVLSVPRFSAEKKNPDQPKP